LKYNARGYLYSSGIPPPQARAAIEGLKILRDDAGKMAKKARDNASALSSALTKRGFSIAKRGDSAIISVRLGDVDKKNDAKCFSVSCLKLGYLCPIMNFDEAPELRITVSSVWNSQMIEQIADALAQAAYENKIINQKPSKHVEQTKFVSSKKEETVVKEVIKPLDFDVSSHKGLFFMISTYI